MQTVDLVDGPDGRIDEKSLPPQTASISLLWQAARCSSAAPTYFKSFALGTEFFMDGGLLNNNPTMQAFTECTNLIHHLNRDVTDLKDKTHLRLVISLGCSFQTPQKSSNRQIGKLSRIRRKYNWYYSLRYVPDIFRISGVAKLLKILMGSACDTTGGVDEGIAWASSIGAAYMRFVY